MKEFLKRRAIEAETEAYRDTLEKVIAEGHGNVQKIVNEIAEAFVIGDGEERTLRNYVAFTFDRLRTYSTRSINERYEKAMREVSDDAS